MHKQGKVWGSTQCIFSTNNVEVHRIDIHNRGYCSKHKHNTKYNAFFIEHGELLITTWKNDYDLVDVTNIKDEEMTVVKPGEYHMFEALTPTVAYEIYWSESTPEDIVRETCGGIRKIK
jgi:mannose-6-phosphate isomerase-like protein (cupin superfamily)